jgi:hypothetical protein
VVVLGYALPVFLVAFMTLLQVRTPQRLMGRVSTAATWSSALHRISIASGALLVSLLSYRTIYWLCAAVILLAAGYLHAMLRGDRASGVVDTPEAGVLALPPAPPGPLEQPLGLDEPGTPGLTGERDRPLSAEPS